MNPLVSLVHQIARPLKARMNAMIARAVLDAVNDGTGFQAVEVTVGSFGQDENGQDLPNKFPGVEHMQQGGVTHVPLADAEGLLLCVQGLRSHPVAILLSNRDQRPKGLQAGETALYVAGGANAGIKVMCKADGSVFLGSDVATQALVQGTAHVAALTTFVTALGSVIAAAVDPTGIPAASKTAFAAALSTFSNHLSAGALSLKHKIDG